MSRLGDRTASVLAAALAAWSVGRGAWAECRLETVADIPVQVRGHRILIASRINDHPGFYILDTGSGVTTLTAAAAARYGVPTHNSFGHSYGINGEAETRQAEIPDLQIGPLHVRRAEVMVLGADDPGATDIAGLLSPTSFAGYDLEFDLAHGRIGVIRSHGCSDDQMDYWRAPYAVAALENRSKSDPFTRVQVKINGSSIEALLDTGSPASLLDLGAAATLGVRTGSPGVVKIGAAAGVAGKDTPLYAATFSSFAVGEEKISHPTLQMAQMFANTVVQVTGSAIPEQIRGPQMLLGLDFLLAHRVLVSHENERMYFSYNGGPIFAAPETLRANAPAAAHPPGS
jgi:predicted aspartyl protease